MSDFLMVEHWGIRNLVFHNDHTGTFFDRFNEAKDGLEAEGVKIEHLRAGRHNMTGARRIARILAKREKEDQVSRHMGVQLRYPEYLAHKIDKLVAYIKREEGAKNPFVKVKKEETVEVGAE